MKNTKWTQQDVFAHTHVQISIHDNNLKKRYPSIHPLQKKTTAGSFALMAVLEYFLALF